MSKLTSKCCKNEALIKASIKTLKVILISEGRKSAFHKTSFFLSFTLNSFVVSVRGAAIQKKFYMNLQ